MTRPRPDRFVTAGDYWFEPQEGNSLPRVTSEVIRSSLVPERGSHLSGVVGLVVGVNYSHARESVHRMGSIAAINADTVLQGHNKAGDILDEAVLLTSGNLWHQSPVTDTPLRLTLHPSVAAIQMALRFGEEHTPLGCINALGWQPLTGRYANLPEIRLGFHDKPL